MIKTLTFKYSGINSIILNNPQCVDPLNHYSKELQKINKKRTKTEEDILHRYDLEVSAKLYWHDNKVVIPTTWITASVCKVSHKLAKIAKAEIRSGFFPISDFVALEYPGSNKVKNKQDIIGNSEFRWLFPTKQGQVKVMKAFPMFENWSFSVGVEFDDSIIDEETLVRVAEYGARFNGFGDFRPTYGRASLGVT